MKGHADRHYFFLFRTLVRPIHHSENCLGRSFGRRRSSNVLNWLFFFFSTWSTTVRSFRILYINLNWNFELIDSLFYFIFFMYIFFFFFFYFWPGLILCNIFFIFNLKEIFEFEFNSSGGCEFPNGVNLPWRCQTDPCRRTFHSGIAGSDPAAHASRYVLLVTCNSKFLPSTYIRSIFSYFANEFAIWIGFC